MRLRPYLLMPVFRIIPALSDRCSMRCRAAAYRLARHALVDLDSAEELHKQPLEWFIVKYCICFFPVR